MPRLLAMETFVQSGRIMQAVSAVSGVLAIIDSSLAGIGAAARSAVYPVELAYTLRIIGPRTTRLWRSNLRKSGPTPAPHQKWVASCRAQCPGARRHCLPLGAQFRPSRPCLLHFRLPSISNILAMLHSQSKSHPTRRYSDRFPLIYATFS